MSSMSVDQYRQAQEAEYSAYEATEPIYVDGALAFLPGHPVPKGHVDRGVVRSDQVAKAGSKAAEAAKAAVKGDEG